MEELDAGKFFDKSRLSEMESEFKISLEVNGGKGWVFIAAPKSPDSKLPSLRVDETGIIRHREDGKPPTKDDPAYR